jgi:uncharacterized membrane protein
MKNKYKVDNLQEDKKFEYYVRFSEFPIIPINLTTFIIFFGTIILTIFAIYIGFMQTGTIEEFRPQLSDTLGLFMRLIYINMFLIFLDIVFYIYNIRTHLTEKNLFLKKYTKNKFKENNENKLELIENEE